MNTNTATMSPADFFALDRQCAQIVGGEVWCLFDTEKKRSVRAAVAALVAERDALRTALVALRDAGPNGATAFAGWHPAYADATRLAIEALSMAEARKPEGGAA